MNASLIAFFAAAVVAVLALAWALMERRRAGASSGVSKDDLIEAMRRQFTELRTELDQKAASQRMELTDAMTKLGGGLDGRIGALTENFDKRLTAFAELQQKVGADLADGQHKRLGETNKAVGELTKTLTDQQAEGRKTMGEELEKVRQTLSANMEQLRKENEAKLEQMRLTVDEKLQSTLAERLGENFKMVSERLDTVHRGLGEMQALAIGVGDLKRTLGNIKARGSWGEVQLGALLDDMLTPEQYGRQVRVRPGTAEAVDYAIYLPGAEEGGRLLLPIDCKFPQADYDTLLGAQELGDPLAVEAASKALEKAIRIQAKSIRDKYVHPPETTPFAILYLPTEGLFAEVIRRPGLATALSNDFSVTVTGPTTLAATLNSLKMGFQTLAIQKNAGDIAKVLGMAKAEFQKYATVWDKLGNQLDTARKTVDEAGRRTRAVERQLRNVEVVTDQTADVLLLEADEAE